MISLNATICVQVLLFLVLLFILNKKMIQPLHKVILERQNYVNDKLREFENLEKKLRDLESEYERRLQEARTEAQTARNRLKEEGIEYFRQTMADVQRMVSEMRQKVRADMEEELNRARQNLHEVAESLSYDFVERILGRRL